MNRHLKGSMQMQRQQKKVAGEPLRFKKAGLVKSPAYTVVERDILKIVLKEDEEYTLAQIKKILTEFKRGI